MPGYMMCHGSCVTCATLISFNPNRVPSLRVGGKREPLCRSCFARWNKIHRTDKGLDPLPLDPNAYEPEPEEC